MEELSPNIISSLNSALQSLTGSKRRSFAAELCENYFNGSARKMENYLCVSRTMVNLGLSERRTGIVCQSAFKLRGRKKKNV
jgi:hypothetical protein